MDAEFILVFIDTKFSIKQQELVEKSQIFQRVLKLAGGSELAICFNPFFSTYRFYSV